MPNLPFRLYHLGGIYGEERAKFPPKQYHFNGFDNERTYQVYRPDGTISTTFKFKNNRPKPKIYTLISTSYLTRTCTYSAQHPKTLNFLDGRFTHGQLTSCGVGNPAISLRAGATPSNTLAPGAPNTAKTYSLSADPTHQRLPLHIRYAHSKGSGICSSSNLPPLDRIQNELNLQAEQTHRSQRAPTLPPIFCP